MHGMRVRSVQECDTEQHSSYKSVGEEEKRSVENDYFFLSSSLCVMTCLSMPPAY